MKVTYPVIFTDVNTNILVEVPDLGILTEANEEGKGKALSLMQLKWQEMQLD